MITCKICNKEFRRITHNHLKRHNTTIEEYLKDFPGSELMTEEVRNSFSTNREEYWINKHGKVEGKKKYEEYKEMLAEKNTFEYKQKKFGWTKEEFNEFNKSRAVTKENLIKRHGKEKGLKIWNEYRERQSFTGCKKEYFIEKYGEKTGTEMYESINEKKKHTLDTFIEKYGIEEGEKKYYNYISKKGNGFALSKGHIKFIESLLLELKNNFNISLWKIYEGVNGKEFVIWDKEKHRAWLYDLVITSPIQVCIEYDGDYWHCNPAIFNENDTRFDNKKALDIWTQDKHKQKVIENRGFKVYRFWDSEFINNPEKIIDEVINWIQQHHK